MATFVKPVHALACLLCLGTLDAANNGGHPIEKVINLLKDLRTDAIAGGKKDEVAYQKFDLWCSTSIGALNDGVAEEKETIDELDDTLSGRTKENDTLTEEIAELGNQVADMQAADHKASKQRGSERETYGKKSKDLTATIDAVDEALDAMTSAGSDTEAKMMFAQKHVEKVLALISLESSVTKRLQAFADPKRPKLTAEGDLEAHHDKYDFKSENVIELLKELKTKFEDEKLATIEAETSSRNDYELARLARQNAIKAAQASAVKKSDESSRVTDIIKETRNALKNENDDYKVDKKALADTDEQCATKKEEWETRSKVREGEIDAMSAAIEILAKASGVRTEAPGNPIPPAPVDFLQVESESNPKLSAVAVLREVAKKTHSRALERLAVEVKAHLSGPFDQVNNMIEKMIFVLMDEQKQEDEHKHWCDQEIEKSETMVEKRQQRIDDLVKSIDIEKAKVAELTKNIAHDDELIADIVDWMSEATEIRKTGHKENALAVKDAEKAQTALENAIAVLTTFYKESSMIPKKPWEFIQEDPEEKEPRTVKEGLPADPDTWGSSYTGVTDPTKPGGIITVLEAVMSDFSKMEADTKSQEAIDQKEYDQSMLSHKKEKTRRTTESKMMSDEKRRRAEHISQMESQAENTHAELETTEKYLKDLKPACVTGDSSYDDRKAARGEELQALRRAQRILTDANKKPTKAKDMMKFLEIQRHTERAK